MVNELEQALIDYADTASHPEYAAWILPNGTLVARRGAHATAAHEILRRTEPSHKFELNSYGQPSIEHLYDDLDDVLQQLRALRLVHGDSIYTAVTPTLDQIHTLKQYPEFSKIEFVEGPPEAVLAIKRALRAAHGRMF